MKKSIAFPIMTLLTVATIALGVMFGLSKSDLSSTQTNLTNTQSQLSSTQADLTNTQSQLSSIQADLTNTQNQLSSTQADLTSTQNQLSSAKAQVTSLQNQLSSGGSQVASLQSQLSSANSQISSLQSQNRNLQSIVNLSQSSSEASSVTVNQSANSYTEIIAFTANYAGYVVVSGTSTTSNGYLMVTDSYNGYPFNNTNYTFGTANTKIIPILPGTVTVYFGNTNLINGASATITVTYYY